MAKDTIGSMTAVVRATAGQFAADINAIKGSVKDLQHTVESSQPSGGIFDAIQNGFGIGAGVAAAQAAINGLMGTLQGFFHILSSSDDLADFAQQIGSTSTELSELRFAASQGGGSIRAFDASIQKMVQKIGEARAGLKETRLAFEALGLDINLLARMSAGEAFKTIADAFKQIKNPADQAALAMDIFGKQGVNLVNVLNQGRDGIDALIQSGREMGAVLGNEDVAAAAAASDAIEALTASWDNMKQKIAVEVVPVLVSVMDVMRDIAQSIDMSTVKFVAQVAAIVATIAIVPKLVTGLVSIVRALRAVATAQAIALAFSGPGGWAALAVGVAAAGAAAYGVSKAFEAIEERQRKLQKTASPVGNAAESSLVADLEEQQKKAEEAQKNMEKMRKRAEVLANQFRSPLEEYQDTVKELSKLLNMGALDWNAYQRAVAGATKKLNDATKAKKKTATSHDNLQGIAAAERGTTAGFSAVQSAARLQTEIQRRQAEMQAAGLAEARKQTELQKGILAGIAAQTGRVRVAEL